MAKKTRPPKSTTPNTILATRILEFLWGRVINGLEGNNIDTDIDSLINSEFVGIRYCLPTQLLGKLVDNNLDCLCLQKGDGTLTSQWDPRSFSMRVIAPWVIRNQNVLGTSANPYVGKPLRTPYLRAHPDNVRGKNEWILLYNILNDVQGKSSRKYTREKMILTLNSVFRRFNDFNFQYIIPGRISMGQTENLVKTFLSESSGGARGLSVAAALFQTFGKYFGIFSDVQRFAINASEESTGLAGDIECIGEDGVLRLTIEVKERMLTLTDVQSSVRKAKEVWENKKRVETNEMFFREFLLNAPGNTPLEESDIKAFTKNTWNQGTNVYFLSTEELIRVGLPLAGESARIDFLENIGKQLDDYSTQPKDRKRWKELLESDTLEE